MEKTIEFTENELTRTLDLVDEDGTIVASISRNRTGSGQFVVREVCRYSDKVVCDTLEEAKEQAEFYHRLYTRRKTPIEFRQNGMTNTLDVVHWSGEILAQISQNRIGNSHVILRDSWEHDKKVVCQTLEEAKQVAADTYGGELSPGAWR